MIEFDEALERLLALASPLPVESLGLAAASGRVLGESIVADFDDPPFDRSAMDGYCLRHEDLSKVPTELTGVGEILAGGPIPVDAIGKGECMAIMTGAPLPAGADAVQRVENTEMGSEEGRVRFLEKVAAGAHIRFQGEVAKAGEEVISAGSRITPEIVGVLAACGHSTVRVHRAPRVFIVATGDELVGIDDVPGPGQIRDSNRWLLAALARSCGAEVTMGPLLSDEDADLVSGITSGLDHDVLVLSGGVSVGRRDRVTVALDAVGAETLFHKVRIKPGKPVLVARKENCLVVGTPGNPVSAAVVGRLFLVPLLRKLSGVEPTMGPVVRVILRGPLKATGNRDTFHPARISFSSEGIWVEPISLLGSADAIHHARGNAWIRQRAGAAAVEAGEEVEVWLDGDSLFVGGKGPWIEKGASR